MVRNESFKEVNMSTYHPSIPSSSQTWMKPLPGHEDDYYIYVQTKVSADISFIFSLCTYPKKRDLELSPLNQSEGRVVSKATWVQLNPTFYYSHRMFLSSFDRNLRSLPLMTAISSLLKTWKTDLSASDVVMNVMMSLASWEADDLSLAVLLDFLAFMKIFCVDTAKPGTTIHEEYVGFVRLQGMVIQTADVPEALAKHLKENSEEFWKVYGEVKQDLVTCGVIRPSSTIFLLPHLIGYSDLTHGFNVPVYFDGGGYVEESPILLT